MASGTDRRHRLARLRRRANEFASVLSGVTWLVYNLIQEYQNFRFEKAWENIENNNVPLRTDWDTAQAHLMHTNYRLGYARAVSMLL
jgi:hypothetical protein